MISQEDIERAICGDASAQDFITAYGAHDRTRWDKLISTNSYDDEWSGRAIFAAGGGSARRFTDSDFHPRRGNSAIFSKYEGILHRFGLNNSSNDVQHICVPADTEPPTRLRDGIFQCQKKFGIPVGGSTNMRTIPISAHEREVPPWVLDDTKVREFILHRFPTLADGNKRVRKRAGELAAVLYFWYRALLPPAVIAEELGIAAAKVVRIAHAARRHGDRLFSPTGCDCRNAVKVTETTEEPLETAPKSPSL